MVNCTPCFWSNLADGWLLDINVSNVVKNKSATFWRFTPPIYGTIWGSWSTTMSAPKLCLLVYNQMDTIVVSVINHCEIGVKFNLPHILQILLFDHSSRGYKLYLNLWELSPMVIACYDDTHQKTQLHTHCWWFPLQSHLEIPSKWGWPYSERPWYWCCWRLLTVGRPFSMPELVNIGLG